MRALYAPDSYGGFFTAPEACRRVCDAVMEVTGHPMADGGAGTSAALRAQGIGAPRAVAARGPHGEVRAVTVVDRSETTFIESAQVIGPVTTDPMTASSAGLAALLPPGQETPGREVIVGLGGSGTVDGGIGLAGALGLRLLDRSGVALPPTVASLRHVVRITGEVPAVQVTAWADVRTPLAGAAPLFGPQKGLSPNQVAMVRHGLLCWAEALNRWRIRRRRRPIHPDLRGGGAAGGLGFGLAALLDAELAPGAASFGQLTDLETALNRSSLVIIGEGRLDPPSFQGKVAGVVTRMARRRRMPVLALVGAARAVPPPPIGPDRVIVIGEKPDRDTAFNRGVRRLRSTLDELVTPRSPRWR